MTSGQVRFDVAALRELAGAKTFARGQEYFQGGSVEVQSLSSKRVVAQVAGSEDYRTVLTGRGADIDGECSCPAFTDRGFCKHMVAAALAANAAGDGAEAEADHALSRMRQHLKGKGVDALVDLILGLAEQDPELFRRLDMESTVVAADDKTLRARLRKAIDAAMRLGSYVDYRAAPRWRSGVETALDAVAEIASGPRAKIAFELIEHAIDRIEAAFEAIDDSDGHLGALLHHACEIHLMAARAAGVDGVELARNLFKREMKSDFETFAGAAADYADMLGEQGLAEYRRLATAAWDKLAAKVRKPRDSDDDFSVYRLQPILDFFAERDGDVEARIALRAKNLTSQWNYLQLAEFCLAQGRKEEALRRAEEGLWLFEDDRPDERLLFFAVKLLTKAGRKADAEAHLWRAFEKQASLELYKQLHRTGGAPAADRAVALLEDRLTNNEPSRSAHRADLLVSILMEGKRFDTAWSIVHKFGASPSVKQTLVEATDTKYPREALEFYAAQVEQLAGAGIYADAGKLIGRMAKLRKAPEHAAFVADLKVRHARKRNFMKLLE
jgi:SWIM zinc finger